MQTGQVSDRIFVVQQGNRDSSSIQVLKSGKALEEVGTISSLKNVKNQNNLIPIHAMPTENDRKMLMVAQGYDDKVQCLDLERGKVVQEFDSDSLKVSSLFATNKDYEEPTFMGMNQKAVFLMDPRIAGSKNGQRARAYQYSTNPQLCCASTDASGHIVLGSRTGQLRLFDGEANKDGEIKKAKSLLSGLTGTEPILSVDVTADGSWILATCKTALLLIYTKLKGDTSGKLGFQKSFGQEKPEPIKLELDIQDLWKYNLTDVSFTPAKFEKTADREDCIVTSTGSLAIFWDFTSVVKRGKLSAYSIKPMGDYIISSSGKNNTVAIMYDDEVQIHSRRKSQRK